MLTLDLGLSSFFAFLCIAAVCFMIIACVAIYCGVTFKFKNKEIFKVTPFRDNNSTTNDSHLTEDIDDFLEDEDK